MPAFDSGMIVYFAADLLWASKIKATADALGLACRPVRNMEMLEARLADSPVGALLVDLASPEIAMAMIARVKPRGPEIRVLAFGPHIERETLQAARAAGADEVLTRGAFDHNMDQVLLRFGSGSRT
ncbi:MAG: response regulator transcription factor [Planctomycetes bacterium]|nr:response regulator transcription factor [Planctomycetota bacterium]